MIRPETLLKCAHYGINLGIESDQDMIRTVKGDITKVTDVQAIVNAAKIAVRTVARFLQENPGQFDLVEWMLFDSHTESVYEAEVDQLYKMI